MNWFVTISTLAMRALAVSSWSSSTSSRTRATTDGSTRISPTVITKATTNRCQMEMNSESTSSPKSAITRPRHACVTRIVRRLSQRSTNAPPIGPNATYGSSCAAVTPLTRSGDSVSVAASSGSANRRRPSPALVISEPTNNALNAGPSERFVPPSGLQPNSGEGSRWLLTGWTKWGR